MKKFVGLKTMLAALLLASCSKESPELIPCMCDGSESTLGLFDCMCEPVKKKPVKRFSYLQDTNKPRYQTLIIDEDQQDAYFWLHQSRNSFAPIKLEYVDFRIKKGGAYENYNDKLGNYRFRIFGCRRESKNVFLNQGRAMQKDMRFFDVFFETMNDFYPVVVEKSSPYYSASDKIQTPEYIMTAEITDYFMNICDEFDWENVKQKKLRSGSSEMTVVWRVMSLDKQEVYCKGMTTGYGQISEGEPNGETLLVERAFEDALTKVPEIQCFNSTVAQRIRPEDLARQIGYLQGLEARNQTFASQYGHEMRGVEMLQECSAGVLPANKVVLSAKPEVVMQPVVTTSLEPVYSIAENSGVAGTGAAIEMTSGVAGTGAVVAIDSKCKTARIDEKGGVVIQNVSDNVKITDDYWVEIPLETENKALVDSKQLVESSFADSVENAKGQKGAGLIVANNLVLTSADLMVKDNNNFKLKTINGKEMKAAAMRVNPNKNVALLLLEEPTQFAPLPLSLDLPEVNKDILLTLGLLDFDTEGEGYLDNEGKVVGYRWSENGDAEIIVDTFVQTVTLGGALIDKNGNIVGLAHKTKKTDDNPDLFIPIETALKGLGLEICGRDFGTRKPAGFKATPLADAIDASKDKTPVPVKGLERK